MEERNVTLTQKELLEEARSYFYQIRKMKHLVNNAKQLVEDQRDEIEKFGNMAKISYRQALTNTKKSRRSTETTLLTL